MGPSRMVQKMLSRVIGEDIELVAVLHPSLMPVKADPGQIEQVLMNLAINSRDAMPQGGKLTMETSNVIVTPDQARDLDLEAGRYVMLKVTDTGTGMDSATLPHIFEPFFSTKPMGKGTGLGLAMVYGIVKQAAEVSTRKVNQGTEQASAFICLLPKRPRRFPRWTESARKELRAARKRFSLPRTNPICVN